VATSVQFSIRSLLIAMVLTAVGLAAGLPIVRSWGTSTQLHFVVNAAILATLVSLFTSLRCVIRRHTERRAGKILLRAETQGNHFVRFFQVCLLILFMAGLIFMAASEAHSVSVSRPGYAKFRWFNIAYLGWMAAWIMTNCWWAVGPGIAELAENGLIEWGTRFTPYTKLRDVRWNRYFPDTLVLSSGHQFRQIVVPRLEREQIERLFDEQRLASSQADRVDEESDAKSQTG